MSMLIKRTVSMIMVILMVLSLAPASLAESIRRGGEDLTPASVTTDEGATSTEFATVRVIFDAVVTVFEKDATGFVEIGTKQVFTLAPGTYYYSVAGSDAKIPFSFNGDKDTKHIITSAEPNAELTGTGDQQSESKNLDAVSQISLGSNFSCALHDDFKASCWGNDYSGQLGNKERINLLIPGYVSAH